MAKYILQFIFLGYDGFRFPVAYFPTAGIISFRTKYECVEHYKRIVVIWFLYSICVL